MARAYRSRFGSRGKYNSIKVEYDGWTFDSTGEGLRYLYWKSELLAGRITAMRPDPFAPVPMPGSKQRRPGGKRLWVLVPGKRAFKVALEPDFEVWRGAAPDPEAWAPDLLEDFKGSLRTATEGYRIKARMFRHVYPDVPLHLYLADAARSFLVPPFPRGGR